MFFKGMLFEGLPARVAILGKFGGKGITRPLQPLFDRRQNIPSPPLSKKSLDI
jgi:hypothetical protein